MPVDLPGPDSRWRCGVCGNLTRFDVIRTTRSRDFVHVELSGEGRVEERAILSEVAEHVTCRWCGAQDQVLLEARPSGGSAAS